MSQGTPIDKLAGNSMNQDDSRLVDSILNDLNSNQEEASPPTEPRMGGPPQQMNPEQHKAMLAHRQQQMMQQQMMMQQQQQQAMMQQQQQDKTDPTESILEKIQEGWKGVLVVFVLSVLMNTEIVDNVFKMDGITMFLTASGGLNIQATVMKAVVVTLVYFIITSFVPL